MLEEGANEANLSAAAWLREAAAKVRARGFEDKPADTTTQPRGHDANIHAGTREAGSTPLDAQAQQRAVRDRLLPSEGHWDLTCAHEAWIRDLQSSNLKRGIVIRRLQSTVGSLESKLQRALADLRTRLDALESSTQPRTLDTATGTAKKV